MIYFYGEELLAPQPTPKLEDHNLSAVCDCLLNIFVATPHIGGRSSICNLRMRHTMVTGTHLSWTTIITIIKNLLISALVTCELDGSPTVLHQILFVDTCHLAQIIIWFPQRLIHVRKDKFLETDETLWSETALFL
jgi:hypothetical protein